MAIGKSKIGIFDSGLGGLTVFKSVKQSFPNESFIYLGDLANLPYGDKSHEAIINRSKKIVKFLIDQRVSLIIVACNSASSVALDLLKKNTSIPIIGVIKPSILEAINSTKSNSIGIIGTHTTINSKAYQQTLAQINDSKTIYNISSVSCPLFVPLIEEGWEDTNIAFEISEKYLIQFKDFDIDTIILACTHYRFLFKTLHKVFNHLGFKNLHFVDCGESISNQIAPIIGTEPSISTFDISMIAHDSFYITDTSYNFNSLGSKFLGYQIPEAQLIYL